MLDDHQGILDGYQYRLREAHDIDIVATMTYGEELEPMLAQVKLDVLLLDLQVPTSPTNANPYPILHLVPKLFQQYPDLAILVISMHNQRALIKAVMDAGCSGYILKDDHETIRELANVIRSVAYGGIHMSPEARRVLAKYNERDHQRPVLTARQIEVISLCAAYPDASTAELAKMLKVAHSTIRNVLSSAYIRLEAHNRAGAIAKARRLNLIPPEPTKLGKQ